VHAVADVPVIEEGLAAGEATPHGAAKNLFTLFWIEVGEKADLHHSESVFAPGPP
jgi:hypothetical protein